eukprot:1151484-Pelagomonas_calceolata.AAC.6
MKRQRKEQSTIPVPHVFLPRFRKAKLCCKPTRHKQTLYRIVHEDTGSTAHDFLDEVQPRCSPSKAVYAVLVVL